MGEKVTLEIVFDDKSVSSGIGALSKKLGAARGAGGAAAGGKGGAAAGGGEGGGTRGGGLSGIAALVLKNLGQPISNEIKQSLSPLRTAFQKQESIFRASASAAGIGAGAAAGAAFQSNPVTNPTGASGFVEVGAQAGQLAADVGAEALLQSDEIAERRFVNERVNSLLQAEGAERAAFGQELGEGDATQLGRDFARAAALEFQNAIAAVRATNAATGGLFGADADIARSRGAAIGNDAGAIAEIDSFQSVSSRSE